MTVTSPGSWHYSEMRLPWEGHRLSARIRLRGVPGGVEVLDDAEATRPPCWTMTGSVAAWGSSRGGWGESGQYIVWSPFGKMGFARRSPRTTESH
jgi:hypothetical protein